MPAPLSGIRVVELASFVAAPAAGALLADLGAEVIKVEVPWGEIYRHSLPRHAGFESDFPLAPHFQMDNRGKRSVALDLALPEAVAALQRLVGRADVLLTNMLPARLARLGLDPAVLRAKRPELIVARLSGYGPDGPEANSPAFDYSTYWARTGFMDMLHEPEAPPAFQRPGMGDHSASLALVVGILSALRQRDRGAPGQVIDVALQHIGFYIIGNDAAMTLATGQTPPRHDRRAARNPLWNHYRTQDDRWLFLVMVESDRYWPAFTRALELDALTDDPRFDGAVQRFRNNQELVRILDERFASRPLAAWTERLAKHRLIWSPVLTLAEAVHDEQANAYGSFPKVEHGSAGAFRPARPGRPVALRSASSRRRRGGRRRAGQAFQPS
jgi:crotonobetainyl-CoA:carnitine CoA-transferase CaiB-like acyl-CoA transferase